MSLNICSVVIEPTNSVTLASSATASCHQRHQRQHLGKFSSIAFFISVVCISSGRCLTRICDNDSFLHSFYHKLILQGCACWPSSFQACTPSAYPEYWIAVPAHALITDIIHCYAGCQSLIGFITSSVLWCTPSTTVLVHPTSRTTARMSTLPGRGWLGSANTREFDIPRKRTTFGELSLWQVHKNGTVC